MARFDKIEVQIQALRSVCEENLGSREIQEISVDVPTAPLDELYFRKAISWCYVLFLETGPFFRFSANLLRGRPPVHEKYLRAKQLVVCARTAHTHNLHADRYHDQQRLRTYDIWLAKNGGEQFNWENCNLVLLNEVSEVLIEIETEWSQRCEDESDRQDLWRQYELEKRTDWEAHDFDPIVALAAEAAGLNGFDSTAFRKDGDRVQRWRKLVALFDSREAAQNAIDRAIRAELFGVFGQVS